jgi:hypothetical protein
MKTQSINYATLESFYYKASIFMCSFRLKKSLRKENWNQPGVDLNHLCAPCHSCRNLRDNHE